GRGGMGVVYKARQVTLNRIVALKTILTGAQAGPEQRARFRSEGEAIARLQHPNIVHIYAVGEHEGHPFLALEYVDGSSLRQHLTGIPWPPSRAAQLLEPLARAVHALHRQSIVHRDLKPANILLQMQNAERGTQNEEDPFRVLRSAFCVPKVTDFGLAKLLDAA